MRLTRLAIVLAATAMLAACGGRPEGVLIPVASTVPGTSSVEIVVATTRLPDSRPGEMYGGERGPALTFADIVVSIPPEANRKVGEVQWPERLPGDPAKNFVTLKAETIDLEAARTLVRKAAAKYKPRRVLLFVHGYNNRFDDAVYRFAQIVHDSGSPAAPVLFTWPSRASLLAYGYDRESATYSRDALERVLAALAADPNIDEVSVLAHSMGNWVTLEALRQMAIRDKRIPAKIANVMLAAPDVDVDVARTQIEAMGEKRPHFTLFVSTDDRALAVSQRIWGSRSQLGAINPEIEPYKSALARARLDVIDLSNVKTSDSLAHGKFAESPDVVRLIGTRLVEGQPISESAVGLGDRIGEITTGAGAAVGSAAGLILSAPVAVIDGNTRKNYGARVGELVPGSQDQAIPPQGEPVATPPPGSKR